MKQEPNTTKAESRLTKLVSQSTPTTPTRSRISSKTKDCPKQENGNALSSSPFTKPTKSKSDNINNTPQKAKRSIASINKSSVFGSSKSRELEDVKGSKPSKNLPVVERFAKLMRPGMASAESLKKKKEVLEKLEENENLIRSLKTELEKSRNLNYELQSQNNKLSQDLAAAESRIALLNQDAVLSRTSNKANTQKMMTPSVSPPPPPLPPSLPTRITTTKNPSVVAQLYQSLSNRDKNKLHPGIASSIAHNSIVGEIQNRSAHLLAIKADIESKGEFINGLIQKVLAASYENIEDVVHFVNSLDAELSSLSDEQAVLKHFKWPEKKADAMREAAIEYRSLDILERELSSHKVDSDIPCAVSLKKMSTLLDKSEKSIQRLTKLRNSVLISYQSFRIPTDWMNNSGIISKIKQGCVKLANMYVKRITEELGSIRCSEKESTQESLLLQGVQFAYRAQKIAGSLDSETLSAFGEMRQHLKGSQELVFTNQIFVSS